MSLFGGHKITSVDIQGKVLECQVCGHDEFERRSAQLHTAGATMLGMEWANPSAICYVCDRCGYIHWFLPR